MSTSTSTQPRPPQVAWACALATFCSVFVLLVIGSVLADWGSPVLRSELQHAIDSSPLRTELSVEPLLRALRFTLMAVGAACVAAVLAAAWTARGHGGARVLLTVLGAGAPLSAPLLGPGGVGVAAAGIACVVLLWSSPARQWFRLASQSSGSSPAPDRLSHLPRRAPMSHPTPPSGSDQPAERPDQRPDSPSERPASPHWPGPSGDQPAPQWPGTEQTSGQPQTSQQYGATGQPVGGQPYGQQPGYGSAYGQPGYSPQYSQGYGQPYGHGSAGYGADPTRRPGAVTAAAVITFLLSGLALVGFLIGGFAVLVSRGFVEEELLQDPSFPSLSPGQVGAAVTATGLLFFLFALLAVAAIVLAALVLRGRGWARVTLIVLSVLTAVLGLVGMAGGFPLLWTAGAIAVVVLLSLSTSREWFALRGYEGRTSPAGYPSA